MLTGPARPSNCYNSRMQSKASTVTAYLAELPPDRRSALQAVRKVIRANLDGDYEEGMQYGMIGYYVPHRVFPAGYHCDPKQPLPFAGLASQKNHMAFYLMSLYGDDEQLAWLHQAWADAGKKLDMGKCCIRFKRLEDLPLEVLGAAIRRMPARKYIELYQATFGSKARPASNRPTRTTATKKTATRKVTSRKATKKKPAAKKSTSVARTRKTASNKAAATTPRTVKKKTSTTARKTTRKRAGR